MKIRSVSLRLVAPRPGLGQVAGKRGVEIRRLEVDLDDRMNACAHDPSWASRRPLNCQRALVGKKFRYVTRA